MSGEAVGGVMEAGAGGDRGFEGFFTHLLASILGGVLLACLLACLLLLASFDSPSRILLLKYIYATPNLPLTSSCSFLFSLQKKTCRASEEKENAFLACFCLPALGILSSRLSRALSVHT